MAKDVLISWLNDAYAMEQALLPILRNHAQDAEREMPQAASRIRKHIEETEKHAARVEECLKQLGTTPSTVKSTFASLVGSIQSVATGIFSDEAIKNVLMDHGAEQFEVASYRALVAAAEELGESKIATLCEENLREDQLMAAWYEDQIPSVVSHTLAKSKADARL
jgi:ferritin-like metal-binding protein YciE